MITRHLKRLARSIKGYQQSFKAPAQILDELRNVSDLLLEQQAAGFREAHPNPLVRFGRKCYSQADEDGITLEILRRMGLLGDGTYAEIGVGNGTENNTLILALLGWRGFWIGDRDLVFDYRPSARFRYYKEWVTRENVVETVNKGLSSLGAAKLDVISIDVDGNDYYLAEQLLVRDIRPKLFVIEYNAKFPPPISFKIAYDPHHVWLRDDYMGASLASLDSLLAKFGYRLVCCNAQTGSNAFFVQEEFGGQFSDVPTNIDRIYVPPRYRMYHRYGHKVSPKLLEQLLCSG